MASPPSPPFDQDGHAEQDQPYWAADLIEVNPTRREQRPARPPYWDADLIEVIPARGNQSPAEIAGATTPVAPAGLSRSDTDGVTEEPSAEPGAARSARRALLDELAELTELTRGLEAADPGEPGASTGPRELGAAESGPRRAPRATRSGRRRQLKVGAHRPVVVVGGLLIALGLVAIATTTSFPRTGERPRTVSATPAETTGEPVAETPTIPVPTTGSAPVAEPAAAGSPVPDWTPTKVRVPKIEVDAPIDPLGVDSQNALEVPSDPARVGWWSGGAQPGQPDAAVLVGHLDSSTGPAVFFELERLAPGDVIEVDRADSSTARFMVERLESHPKTAFPTLAVYGPTDGSALRLITCFGAFDPVQSSYKNNLVIFANLIP